MSEEQERGARIIALYDSGHRYTEIAQIVGTTKNAVAGILYRTRQHPPRPEPVAKPPEPPPAALEGCRWIDGHPNKHGWRWCGEPTPLGHAWCPAHRARVYTRRPQPAINPI
jgi:hypothetical protein